MKLRPFRSFVRSLFLFAAFTLIVPATAIAQEATPSPAGPEPGICAPWHKCMAYGATGLAVLLLLALGLGYWVQSKGFESMEHRMGQPQGVPVKKE